MHSLDAGLSCLRDTRKERFKEKSVRALGMVKVRMEKLETGQRLLAEAVAQAHHYLRHSWKVYSLSRALAKALEDSREASSWPGDRLQVGTRMSRRVELITQRLQRETDAYAAG